MKSELIRAVSVTVKRLRQDRKLSQEQLADRADLDRTYISGVERGTRNISLHSLEKILTGLSIGLDEFIEQLAKTVGGH